YLCMISFPKPVHPFSRLLHDLSAFAADHPPGEQKEQDQALDHEDGGALDARGSLHGIATHQQSSETERSSEHPQWMQSSEQSCDDRCETKPGRHALKKIVMESGYLNHAGQAPQRTGNEEGRKLRARHIDADRASGVRVGADGAYFVAECRSADEELHCHHCGESKHDAGVDAQIADDQPWQFAAPVDV